jgi:hypothetical protein
MRRPDGSHALRLPDRTADPAFPPRDSRSLLIRARSSAFPVDALASVLYLRERRNPLACGARGSADACTRLDAILEHLGRGGIVHPGPRRPGLNVATEFDLVADRNAIGESWTNPHHDNSTVTLTPAFTVDASVYGSIRTCSLRTTNTARDGSAAPQRTGDRRCVAGCPQEQLTARARIADPTTPEVRRATVRSVRIETPGCPQAAAHARRPACPGLRLGKQDRASLLPGRMRVPGRVSEASHPSGHAAAWCCWYVTWNWGGSGSRLSVRFV